MKMRILTAIATISIFTFGCSSSQTKNGSEGHELSTEIPGASDYFPSGPLTKVFSGGFENEGVKHTFMAFEDNKVQMLQVDSGTSLILVYEVSDDQIRLIYTEEGYYSNQKKDNVIPNRNDIILKSPIQVGTKWDSDRGGFFEITAVDVDVKTPAGSYLAVEVTFRYDEHQTKHYYAKGLGMIRTISDIFSIELVEIK